MKSIKITTIIPILVLFFIGCSLNNSPILKKKIDNDDLSNLKFLLKTGANPNTVNNNGYSLLYEAAYLGDLNATKLLLKYGANINLASNSDSCSRTPLIEALRFRHLKVALFLAQKGADLTQKDSCFERTPLHWLAYRGFNHIEYNVAKQLIQLMKKHGVNFNQEDRNGEIPLDLAVSTYTTKSRADIVDLLLQNGADGTKKTSLANPPIISALTLEVSPKVILYFIKNGVKVRKNGNSLCSQGVCENFENANMLSQKADQGIIDFMLLSFPKEAEKIYAFYEGNFHALDGINKKTKKKIMYFIQANINTLLKVSSDYELQLGSPSKFQIHEDNKSFILVKHFYKAGLIKFNIYDFKTFPKLIGLIHNSQDFAKIAHVIKPSDAIKFKNIALYRYMCKNLNKCIGNSKVDNNKRSNSKVNNNKKGKDYLKEILDKNRLNSLKTLVRAGFNVNKKYSSLAYYNKKERTPLQYIMLKGLKKHESMAKYLIKAGANPNTYYLQYYIGPYKPDKEYILTMAFDEHLVNFVNFLIDHGADKNILFQTLHSYNFDERNAYFVKIIQKLHLTKHDFKKLYFVAVKHKNYILIDYLINHHYVKNVKNSEILKKEAKEAKEKFNRILHSLIYSKWDFIDWSGKVAKDGWPTGKGTITLNKTLSQGGLIVGGDIAHVTIEVTIHKHKILNGKISAGIYQRMLLVYRKVSEIYESSFYGINGMNDKIVSTINKAISEKNGRIMQTGSKCHRVYNKCMSYCKLKSSKGFFNDRDSCQNACIGGKIACERGDYTLGKMTSCRGICKGINNSNGAFFGWDASNFDKCVDSCSDIIGE